MINMVLVMYIMMLELYVMLRLCLNEQSLYVERNNVYDMMNEGLSMNKS